MISSHTLSSEMLSSAMLASPDARAFLNALLQQTPIGLAFFDRDYRFVHVNAHLAAINGYAVEAHLGRTVQELLPSLWPAFHDTVQRMVESGESCATLELSGETPAQPGVVRRWLEHWFPVRSNGDGITGFGVVVQEITDRARAVAELAKRTQRLDLLARVSHDLITQSDAGRATLDRIVQDVADTLGFETAFMYRADPAARCLYLEHSKGVPDELLPTLGRIEYGQFLCGRVAESRGELVLGAAELVTRSEGYALCVSGLQCYAGFPIIAHGELFGTASFASCTARELEEGELQLLRTVCDQLASTMYRERLFVSARMSEERLRLSMEAAYLIGFTWDIVKDEVHRVYSASDVLPPTGDAPARLSDVLAKVHPDDRESFMQALDRAFSRADGRYENEFRLVASGGGEQWTYERGVVSFDGAGRPTALVGVSQDITIRKRAEQAVQESNRRKDEFLATLAHELRNPLAPIRNGIELLRDDAQMDASSRRAVGIIDRQVTHMVRLVDDLLDLNRITRGEVVLHMRPLNLAEVVRAAVETTRPVIQAAAHELSVQLPSPPVFVMGDATRLSQALGNLLGNAARYTPQGGEIEVEVRVEPSPAAEGMPQGVLPAMAVVAVRDNGAGVAAEMCERIFEMFTQAPDTRGRGGLGIGLAIVRQIATMHGGTVTVFSDGPGKGSTFELRLPVIAPPSLPDPWIDRR